jgi:hypothetical protein
MAGNDRHLAMANLARFGNGYAVAVLPDSERDVFAQWDERASVRVKARPVLQAQADEWLFFPPELVPPTAHPLVEKLGPSASQRLLVHRLYQYLHFTVELEALAVVPVTLRLSRRRGGLMLPESMVATAFKITTDEAWHGQFSYDLMAEVEAATGVTPRLPEVPQFVRQLELLRRSLDGDLCGVDDLLFAVVSETLISTILSDLPRDRRLPPAVRETVSDHAQDEGRHHAYFAKLLRYLWPALSRSQQRRFGPLLPGLIAAFLEPDRTALRFALLEIGVAAADLDQVLAESYPGAEVSLGIAQAARATVGYFREVGALEDAQTADAFAASGLLAG